MLGFVLGLWHCYKRDMVTSMEYLWWSHFVPKNFCCTASFKKYLSMWKQKSFYVLFFSFKIEHWSPHFSFFFFVCWLMKPPVNSTEGTAPVTLNRQTRARARMNHFWPGLCLRCIRSDNQVFSQMGFFFMRLEHYKVIIFRSEPLHDPV